MISKFRYIVVWVEAFALLTVTLFVAGKYNFSYMEHMTTFYAYADHLRSLASRPGGCAQIAADWLIQFFADPAAGVLITSAVLATASMLCAVALRQLSGSQEIMQLALLPPVAMAFLHYNINYAYAGTIGITLMLGALCLRLMVRPLAWRLGCDLGLSALLFYLAGPAAMLYAATVMAVEIILRPKSCYWFALCALLVWGLGAAAVAAGSFGELRQVLTPEGWFTLRLKVNPIVWQPWGVVLVVIAIGAAYRYLRPASARARQWVAAVAIIAAVAWAALGLRTYIVPGNEQFKQMNCYIRNGEWDKVIDLCSRLPMNNLLHQNCLNLALAERGELADSLFNSPCIDIRSIYINNESSPYIYMLLSDIYYSMGHIALAQRHAFEANEGCGDLSPRMLQRLVDTNIIFGRYAVAEKYLSILSTTRRYADWARSRRALLNDAAADASPELGQKRRCIFPDNRFSATLGLDDDLRQILRANPDHKITLQYLGSLYLLSKDIPRFLDTMSEFSPEGQRLPKAFREGVMASSTSNPDSLMLRYDITAADIKALEEYQAAPTAHKDTYWFFQKYIR